MGLGVGTGAGCTASTHNKQAKKAEQPPVNGRRASVSDMETSVCVAGTQPAKEAHEVANLDDLDGVDDGSLDELHQLKLKDLTWSPGAQAHRSALHHTGEQAAAPSGTQSLAFMAEDDLDRDSAASRKLLHKVSFAGNTSMDGGCPFSGHKKSRAGEEVAMKKIVDLLYAKVLSDERLAFFYEGVNMERLKNQQEKLMILVFGGTDLMQVEDPNLDMRRIHLRLIRDRGLSTQHWELFVQYFEHVLEEVTLPEEQKAMARSSIRQTMSDFRPLEPGEWEAAGLQNGGL